MAYPPLPGPAAAPHFLAELARRREFAALAPAAGAPGAPAEAGAAEAAAAAALGLPEGLRAPGLLHAPQLFVAAFAASQTPYERLLLNWQPGTGKSLAAAAAALAYARGRAPGQRQVAVLGFTRAEIQNELLRRPELGLVSEAELAEWRRLQLLARQTGEPRPYRGYVSTLKRRLTDSSRGGFFRFYGYREFVLQLLRRTPAGETARLEVGSLFEGPAAAAAARVAAAEQAGLLRVNRGLLAELRRGLIIADEAHNLYNAAAANQYGAALQYVLDCYPPGEGPRALFLTATPLNGGAEEVVDLLNLLVPRRELPGGRPLARGDLFAPEGGLLPGALEQVAALAAGRVSFLVDGDASAYPRRRLLGRGLRLQGRPLPYLRFVPCPLAPRHAAALRRRGGAPLGAGELALYDMVFPDPADPAEGAGLWAREPLQRALAGATAAQLQRAGMAAGPEGEPEGPFLAMPRLALWSGKYARLLADLGAALRRGEGKLLVYHPRVHTSGLLAAAAVLRAAGWGEPGLPATAGSLCSRCGRFQREHPEEPAKASRGCPGFVPARFVCQHGGMERGALEAANAAFGAASNLDGHEVRLLLGSRLITEGRNFQAVRDLYVLALPSDIPGLVQVFGRAVRKHSHAGLPPALREVGLHLYISVDPAGEGSGGVASSEGGSASSEGGASGEGGAGGASSDSSDKNAGIAGEEPPLEAAGLEVELYAAKLREFLRIQEVEQALRRYAVDGFARAPLREASLEGLPQVWPPPPAGPLVDATARAYGHVRSEVADMRQAVQALLLARPCWTYGELWAALRSPAALHGGPYAPAMRDERCFALALQELQSRGFATDLAGEPRLLVAAGPYLLLAPLDAAGGAVPDYGCYLRLLPPPGSLVVGLAAARAPPAALEPDSRLGALLAGGLPVPLVLAEAPEEEHLALLQALVQAASAAAPPPALRPFLEGGGRPAELLRCYLDYGLLLTGAELGRHPAAARYARPARLDLLGYLDREGGRVLRADGGWARLALRDLGREPRFEENDLLVGYCEGGRFKLRPPRQRLREQLDSAGDARLLARGAVCASRSRAELARLEGLLGLPPAAGAAGACRALLQELLRRERRSRTGAAGLRKGLRWFYLFNEQLPRLGN